MKLSNWVLVVFIVLVTAFGAVVGYVFAGLPR